MVLKEAGEKEPARRGAGERGSVQGNMVMSTHYKG